MKEFYKFKHSFLSDYTCGVYILIFFTLLTSYPFIFPQLLSLPSIPIVLFIVVIALIGLSILFKIKLTNLPSWFILILLIQISVWVFYCFIHSDSSYFTRIIFILTSYIVLLSLNNCKGGIRNFYYYYDNWILLMAIGGCLTFIGVLFCNLKPLLIYENIDTRPGYYFGLSATNFYIGKIIRYSGFFDEPGAMASWGMWALLFNRLFIHKKRFEFSLIVLLSFTFSLAYYIQLSLYILFFKLKTRKDIFIFLIIISLVVGSIFISKNSEVDIYRWTFARIELDQAGKLKHNNRAPMTKIAKQEFLSHPIFGLGANNALNNYDYMGDNPFATLAFDGIVGTITVYLPLFALFFLRYCPNKIRKAIIIILVGYLQRPYNVYFIFPFILYSFTLLSFISIRKKKESELDCQHSELNSTAN